ncbi:DUF1850 domain-containing protein [Oceanospirillum linum]|uniref:DUF1850 domain-containing protein n=1 Tax=Oceanospirillum linum TaxID=966 RepID=A0A1T1HE49_OCELI|nr:DUF1850 domain-containing protein [Oceanospirillum linum]OOV88010.1 hypothetical protein BTA35_0200145 [Oceanospirillum linum]SEF40300.1 protein of unknown function [Oleiphilus messinensis]SMP00445.1 protein of unknown function [Oceanospirillum linum]
MKKVLSNKTGIVLLAAAVLQLAACSALGSATGTPAELPEPSLHIRDARNGQHFACVPVTERRFELSFIHSVSLTPVRDLYQIENSTADAGSENRARALVILQTAEHFIAHGQGLPSMAGEPDATAFEHKNGEFILQLQRPIPDLIVRTDHRFKNRLHTGYTTVNLNQWPNTGLRIEPVHHCE